MSWFVPARPGRGTTCWPAAHLPTTRARPLSAATARSSSIAAAKGHQPRYTLAVPLRGRRRALGALVIEGVHLAPGGSLDVVERAEEAGRQLSAALENLQLIEQVRQSHRELEDTFNSLADLVLVCDTVQQVRQVNDAMAARVGRPPRELPGTAASRWLGPALCALIDDVAGGAGALVQQVEDERLGGIFQAAVSPIRVADGRPSGIVLVARDVTERVRLQEDREDLQRRLAHADKLAALGKFVAGIAHELNNPLQGVLGHVELLRAANAFPPSIQREMRHVHREAERAAKIVRNLLVFSGSRRLDRRRLAPATIVSRVIALRTRALRERNITLVREVHAPLPFLHADPLMLQQALLNIVLNAEQAVADRGRIGICRRAHRAGHGAHRRARLGAGHPARHPSARVRTVLHDQGRGRRHRARTRHCLRHRARARGHALRGHSSRRRRRLHDDAPGRRRRAGAPTTTPMNDDTFLTTDEVLEYLQVNLRTVYRLIKAGKLPAVRVGRQWRFRRSDIDAWLESGRVRPARGGTPSATPAPRRVLVADDEASIRDLLAKALAMAEYVVDTAADGRAALDRLRVENYDLLIADLRMPGMDGLSLIRDARRFNTALKVIIITGYSNETSAIEAVNLGVSGYLTKPFRVPQVLSVVARAFGD